VQRQCLGCGAELQSDQPGGLGYLPGHVLTSNQEVVLCQRCYRIRHYGKDQAYTDGFDGLQIVQEGLKWAEGVVLILDLMDFEASIPRNIDRLLRKHQQIIALNKVDLLPRKTTVQEVKLWAKHKLKALGIDSELVAVSGTTGYGIDGLLELMARSSARKWIVVGVTNVGKSSLIVKILEHQGGESALMPTTAVFPGTTVALTRWNLDHSLILSDSPGMVPKGRLTDLVCPDCAVKLIPARRLNVSLYQVNTRSALVVPGLAAVHPQANEDVVMIGFTASQVTWQRANAGKVTRWLAQTCGSCRLDEWDQVELTIELNQDLCIHGLGWISARRQRVSCRLTIPRGVGYSLRANLIGDKRSIHWSSSSS